MKLSMGGLFVLTALSQARVQLFERGEILDRAAATKRFVLERPEPARRGALLTSDGKPLAVDDDRYELSLSFSSVPQSDAFFVDLAAASGIPASEFSQVAASGLKRRAWKQRMSAAQAKAVQAVKTRWRADGVSLDYTGERAYPLSEAASGVVGRTRGRTAEGGLERGFDEALRGTDGRTIGMVDRTGAFLPMRIDPRSKAKEDGLPVVTTLDSVLQQEAAASIKRAVETNHADQGVAIVYDPRNGDLLAMANWPTFNPDEPEGATQVPEGTDYNPNYMGRLEPGSTFKVLTLAKALDLGVVTPNSVINCTGEKVVWGKMSVHCDIHHGSRAHGPLRPVDAIAKSCNVCAATWAQAIGRDTFIEFMRQCGLLDKPGLGVPGEVPGDFVRDEYATGLQLAHFGFGQSVTVTPVALASAFGALANGGVRMKPRLVRKIGKNEEPPVDAGQLFKPATAERMLEYMETVIQSDQGTGKGLRIPGYRLGGKTGTAERQGQGRGGYVSNFVGFVPAPAPRAVILVMVDHPKGGSYYGATVAGPVFDDLARAVIRRYAIPPSPPKQDPTLEGPPLR
ncbi:MAG: penicillin-binding protein 2 [Fimbriimonadaceae bacterium]|nr:penicillin-binding protein 2 [Chthonomonadaceae bacterium]MCO5297600.1 penicillin-binding protein 2 [Fimbriimonadaceae bacterium]